MNTFLPVSKADLEKENIGQLDFVMVTGDAYVDHPSFAHAVISRYLVGHGYSVGIIAQPDWKSKEAFEVLGRPRLGFLVSAGNMDSMVNLYTVAKKRRKQDSYSPGGRIDCRPERTTATYTKMIRQAYGGIPVVIGGIEASLRRFAHYDYWANKVKPSILHESGADLLVYGMGERAILQIAEALDGGLAAGDITYVEGTAYRAPDLSRVYEYEEMPTLRQVRQDKDCYGKAFLKQYYNTEHTLVQKNEEEYIIQNKPAAPLTQQEFDFVYSLPYAGSAHPMYKQPIPALEEVQFSITATRGCIGGCSFCALFYHQGKQISCRGKKSMVEEAERMVAQKGFKGYIHDVGGPTANLYGMKCANPKGMCAKRRCLVPKPCKYLRENHRAYIDVLRTLRGLDGVKKVFVRSGIRHDFALLDKSGDFINELARHHVSGRLKLAPEHVREDVLACMGKPRIEAYEQFVSKFDAASKKCGKKQYIRPYFMSSHPGCTLTDGVALAEYLRDAGYVPDTAQDFYPTPGTLATCMYYTGMDPHTGKPVYVPGTSDEKAMQRVLIHYKNPKNRRLVKKALRSAERDDLIGNGKKALIKE